MDKSGPFSLYAKSNYSFLFDARHVSAGELALDLHLSHVKAPGCAARRF